MLRNRGIVIEGGRGARCLDARSALVACLRSQRRGLPPASIVFALAMFKCPPGNNNQVTGVSTSAAAAIQLANGGHAADRGKRHQIQQPPLRSVQGGCCSRNVYSKPVLDTSIVCGYIK